MDKNYKILLIAITGTLFGLLLGQFLSEDMFLGKIAIAAVVGYIVGYIMDKLIPEKQ